MDLRVAGVAEEGTLAVRPPNSGRVAPHGVGRQEEDVAVAASPEDDGIGGPGLDLTGDHVAGDDAAGTAIDNDQLDHLVTRIHFDGTGLNLALQLLVAADQQLLPRLATGVEGALHLHTTEGPGVQEAAILTCKGDALGNTLVDDVGADLRQAVDVRLAGPIIATLDGVVEQPVGGVVVVAVVLGRVDTALGRDGMGTPGAVLIAEIQDVVAGLTERRGGSAASQAGADDDDAQLTSVGGGNEPGLELAGLPDLVNLDRRRLGVDDVVAVDPVVGGNESRGRHRAAHFRIPNWTQRGMIMNPA